MQPCNRIYYSNVYWRLNMIRTAYRSSSGDLKCICSLWFTYTCGDRPLSSLSGKIPLRLDNGRSPHVYVNQRLQIQFRAPDDERYAARNMLRPSINVRVINSITRLHLVCFYWLHSAYLSVVEVRIWNDCHWVSRYFVVGIAWIY